MVEKITKQLLGYSNFVDDEFEFGSWKKCLPYEQISMLSDASSILINFMKCPINSKHNNSSFYSKGFFLGLGLRLLCFCLFEEKSLNDILKLTRWVKGYF